MTNNQIGLLFYAIATLLLVGPSVVLIVSYKIERRKDQ